MNFRMRHPVTALGMFLAGATLSASTPLPELSPSALKTLTAQQPTRVALAQAYLDSTVIPTLSFGPDDSLHLFHALTNTQGECVVRFQQFRRFPGSAYRSLVFNSAVVVKVAPDGTCSVTVKKVAPPHSIGGQGITSAPYLSPAQALEVMTAKINPTMGFTGTPQVEPIVFPAYDRDDLVLARDPATGLLSGNPLRGGEAFTPRAPYVRAYRIEGELISSDPTQPNARVQVILDAETGAILSRGVVGQEVANPFLYAAGTRAGQPAPSPAVILQDAALKTQAKLAQVAATTASWTEITVPAGTPTQTLVPVVGTGLTQYMGAVPLPTTYDPVLKGYGLLDTTRGGAVNNFTQQMLGYYDTYFQFHPNVLRPAGNMVLSGAGTPSYYTPYTMDGLTGSLQERTGVASDLVTGRPETSAGLALDNVWGNYRNLVPDPTDRAHGYGAFTTAGMSAAAEAMNHLTCTYEFLKYTFNRTSLDDQDTGMNITVNLPTFRSSVIYDTKFGTNFDADGYYQHVNIFSLRAGTGDAAQGLTNAAEPTKLGVAMGAMLWETLLGFTETTTVTDSQAIARGFANLISQGIYSIGSMHGLSRRIVMPTWKLGMDHADGSYDQSMVKPSLDGLSPDGYYDGSSFLFGGSGGFSSGPVNRAWFFMSEGASATAGATTYSEFLPGGMSGIGLEKTCKIAYKAVTEQLASGSHLSVYRWKTALVQAAKDLYGDGSPEVIATTNAWAAVNVGAAYGQPEPIRVWIDMHNYPDDSDLGINGPFEGNERSQRYPWVPAGEPSQLSAHVTGTTDTSVTWTNNPAPYNWSGFYDLNTLSNGRITPEGIFTASTAIPASLKVNSVQVRSKVDPKQWAQGMVFGLQFDWDGSGSNDALDLGMLALAWGMPYPVLNAVNDYIFPGFPGVSEGELQMGLAAFKTAFGN